MSETKQKLYKTIRVCDEIENIERLITKLTSGIAVDIYLRIDGMGLSNLTEKDIEELKMWIVKKQEEELSRQYQLLQEHLISIQPVLIEESDLPSVHETIIINVQPSFLTPEQVEQARWK